MADINVTQKAMSDKSYNGCTDDNSCYLTCKVKNPSASDLINGRADTGDSSIEPPKKNRKKDEVTFDTVVSRSEDTKGKKENKSNNRQKYFKCQRISIIVSSKDQGWSSYRRHHDTRDASYTWIDVEIKSQDDDNDPYRIRLKTNIHAGKDFETSFHNFQFDDDFMNHFNDKICSDLSDNMSISLFTCSLYPGWCCKMQRAEITLYWTPIIEDISNMMKLDANM